MNTENLNHSFQEVEECANERMKEELTFAIINDIKMARMGCGVLTLGEIAKAIQEGVEDDAPTLAGLLYVMNSKNSKAYVSQFEQIADGVSRLNRRVKAL